MSTFLLTAAPLLSHLDWGGYLQTGQELIRRGHRVVWLTEEGVVADYLRPEGYRCGYVGKWHLPGIETTG